MVKLIFLDIDGTLVEAGLNTPPASALDAIGKARQKGNKVFLCSGRNIGMAKPVLDYGFDGIIALAGAYVLVEDEVIYDQPMDQKDFRDLLKILHEDGVFCTVETKDRTYGDENLSDFLSHADGDNSEIERWRKALQSELDIRPMKDYDGSPAYKIVIMCNRLSQLQRAKERYEKEYDFVIQEVKEHGNCLNGELIHRSFDKGKAIRLVAQHYGADISDTIGFGDSMNDLTMIETVGTSLCMGNGAQALKEISDLILPSVTEDGLAEGFELLKLI
ncbi:MAG: HAD family hydrolase [Erysipelotrichaceae bacterium]|nr:HAD family hydrolase [Erysipelotrichaceae bacterium]